MERATPSVAVWITLALGVLLFVSPWIFAFSDMTEETIISVIAGLLVTIASGLAMAVRRSSTGSWISLVLVNIFVGGMVVVSAQIFGFSGTAVWVQELIGIAVIFVTMVEMVRITSASVAAI